MRWRVLFGTRSHRCAVMRPNGAAHCLNLSVVAEGIEDQETADWLLARGCDIGQGYHFARPMPADAFVALAHRMGTGKEKEAA